jgi:Protein of unknown function (DUF1588)/Protein of unknown function (DUF1592)/Protein of unknown function (DUF1585)/Planctomycete cytochrome C
MSTVKIRTACLLLCVVGSTKALAETYTPGKPLDADYAVVAKQFIADNCLDCHGATDPEGNLSLVDLGPVDEINAATWRSIWAQVSLKEMPPRSAEQPSVVERLQFSDWIVNQLTLAMKDKGGFRDHLDPNKGNFVDHDLLFGPLPDNIKLASTSSPTRLWRVTPQEHMARLNELINLEPNYDPEKPGLRTHGDEVPTNHGGELKLYFGVDGILSWVGGTVAYATAVKSAPAVLSSARTRGLENYPNFYTVNSAEATQILGLAEDIIRFMAYGPLSIAEPYQITDDPKSIADKMRGDIRGLPTSLVYSTKIMRPITPVYDLMKNDEIDETRLRAAVDFLFEALTFRPPSIEESNRYLSIVKEAIDKLGKKDGAVLGLSSIFLERDALFRSELAEKGEADRDGRVMLQDWELGLAVNHALRYLKPDDALRYAIVDGRMRTKDDVKREVARMLADDSIRKPRVLRFFREYFDYDLGGYICKDTRSLAQTGIKINGDAHYFAMFEATASSDRLIELILDEDKDVLKQLLTTNKVVATPTDRIYFGTQLSSEQISKLESEAKQRESESKKLSDKKPSKPEKRNAGKVNYEIVNADLSGPPTEARVSHRSFGSGSLKPERVLATAPEGQRMGLLTHPSWLVSHSDAMDNHAIHRGRWIRERLLGGGIPDVPITVDAMLPDEPQNSLRERMRVTRERYCWTCHQKMDPLGLPFQTYNHAGLYRETELDKPVDASGEIIDSGVPSLDGPVNNAIEMIQKIAASERAEQVFVRHAFRFWMGRNETLNDAPVLQQAFRDYKENGGSMKALLTSLLTSDAFLYRTRSVVASPSF